MQILVNKIIVNYEILLNDQTDKYLLILPGWMRLSVEWLNVAEECRNSFNVVIMDFPGFGITPRAEHDLSIFDYAEITELLIRKLKINKCTVLGHSFGGRVGIILASKTDLVDKLILVDSAGLNEKSYLTVVKQSIVNIGKGILRFLPKSLAFKIQKKLGSEDYKSAGDMRKTFVKVVNQSLRGCLKDIKIPTFLIWGDKDTQVSIEETKIFKLEIPHAITRVVWGSGHDPHLEKSDSFKEILQEIIC